MNAFGVKLRVTGLNFARETAKAQEAEIQISRLKKKGVKVHEFFVSNTDYAKILKLGIFKDFSVEVIEKNGVHELFLRLFSWAGILLGMGFGFILFFLGTRYISRVEIIGAEDHVCENGKKCIFEETNLGEFESYIETLGIFVGGKVSEIQKQSAERAILSKYEGISSCSIVLVGTEVSVEIHEGVLKNDHSGVTMDLIAPENGIVTNLVVSSGKPLVVAGQTVKKGQVLVAAQNGKRAMATAVMKLYKNNSYVHSEVSYEFERTGRTKEFIYFDILGANVLGAQADDKSGFIFFEKEVSECYIVPNLFVPIKKIMVKYYETEKKEVIRDVNDVLDSVISKLTKELEKMAKLSSTEERKVRTVITEISSGVFEIDCYLEYTRIIKQ